MNTPSRNKKPLLRRAADENILTRRVSEGRTASPMHPSLTRRVMIGKFSPAVRLISASLRPLRVITPLLMIACSIAYAEDSAWTSLAVYPQEISLATSADYQGIVVVATRADGVTSDVTEEAELAVVEPSFASLESATLRPLADGETQLIAKFSGLEASANVAVTRAPEHRPVSYMLDVMPVFARAGCNSGSCHGAASGKDGFRLSLFGFDPPGDHFRITREQATRRINLAIPTDSLLMEKASGAVQHTGGKCFEAGGKYYGFLSSWLAAGAPSDVATAPTVSGCVTQKFIAVATYSDGTTRDVTDLARLATNNAISTPIDEARHRRRARRVVYHCSLQCPHGRQPSTHPAQRFAIHRLRRGACKLHRRTYCRQA